jgi:hypothetical protein
MTPEQIIIFVIALLLVLFSVFAISLVAISRWTARRVRAMQERFPQALRVEAAALFGQESLGKTQMRGNGVLALLPDQLVFERMAARRDYVIPLAQITGIENPKSYLGKSRGVPLLKVVWRDDSGKTDSIAWQVSGLSDWQAHIEAAREGQTV